MLEDVGYMHSVSLYKPMYGRCRHAGGCLPSLEGMCQLLLLEREVKRFHNPEDLSPCHWVIIATLGDG